MNTGRLALRSLTFVILALLSPVAGAQDAGGTVVTQGTITEDVYLAGGTIEMSANVDGDVLAAGGQVSITNNVSGDVIAAGGNVTIGARVGDDVRVAGGNVTISGSVGDHAVAAGGNVLLAPGASVGGRAWFGGSTVTVAGKVGKELKAAGNTVIVSGQIAGDAELYGQSIEIRPGAVIQGNLTYMSPEEARIAPDAKIAGVVTRAPLHDREERKGSLAARAAGILFYLSLMLTGIVLYLLFPTAFAGAARVIGETPWISFGLGFAILVATPIAAVLLFATLLGAWLGLVLLAMYFVLLLAGFFTGVFYLGEVGLKLVGKPAAQSGGWRALSIIAALVAVWIIGLIPVLGGFAVFVLLLLGLGALTLDLWQHYVSRA